jgi:hypothetical protein
MRWRNLRSAIGASASEHAANLWTSAYDAPDVAACIPTTRCFSVRCSRFLFLLAAGAQSSEVLQPSLSPGCPLPPLQQQLLLLLLLLHPQT